jgi:hypothetical protein
VQNNQPPGDKPNPYATLDNPFDQYQDSLAELAKLHPEVNEFARVCYEIFLVNPDGKILWEILHDKFLMANLVNPTANNCEHTAVYWAGFTDCIKQFDNLAKQHRQRIQAA